MDNHQRDKLDQLRRQLAQQAKRSAARERRSAQHAGEGQSWEYAVEPDSPADEPAAAGALPLGSLKTRTGVCWSAGATLAELSGPMARTGRELLAVLGGARQRWDELAAPAQLCKLADAHPQEALLLDAQVLEGPDGSWISLAGMLGPRDAQVRVDQFLAEGPAQERAVLEAIAGKLEQASVVVTFDGTRTFWPVLEQRLARHGLELWAQPVHLDLLKPARRLWKSSLPNSRRPTIERLIFSRSRKADQAEATAIYQRFAGDGNLADFAPLLERNLSDLVSLSRALVALLTGCTDLHGPADL